MYIHFHRCSFLTFFPKNECPYTWPVANQFLVRPEQVTPFLYNSVLCTSSSSQRDFTYSTLDRVLHGLGLVLH